MSYFRRIWTLKLYGCFFESWNLIPYELDVYVKKTLGDAGVLKTVSFQIKLRHYIT